MPKRLALAVLFLLPFAPPSWAAVDVGPNGMVVKLEATASAPPAKVFEGLVAHVGQWWEPRHTYSGDSSNLSLDPRPGGCFCEKLPNGGGVEHLRVVYVAPNQALRLVGALGPLQASGLAGSLTFQLAETPSGTRIQVSYVVGGFMEGGFEKMGPIVESVLATQIGRLKLFVETGKPTEAPR